MASILRIVRRSVYTIVMMPLNIAWYYLFHKKFTPDPRQKELWEERVESDYKKLTVIEKDPYYNKLDDYIVSRLKDCATGTYLELGCYFGYRLNKFAKEIPAGRFTGLDIGAGNLEFGRKNIITSPNVSLVNADAARLPFKDGSIDTIYTVVCLSHINYSAIHGVIAEIARVSSKRVILVEINLIPMRFKKKIEALNAGYIYLHDYVKLSGDRMKAVSVKPMYDSDNHPRYTVFEFIKT